MKIKSFMAMMMATATMMLTTTACNNDDDEPEMADAKAIEGNYTGKFTITVMGSDSESDGVNLIITSVTDNTVDVTLPAAGEGAMALPELVAKGISVTKTKVDGIEVIAGTAENISGTVEVNGTSKSFTINSIAIAGKGNDLTVTYNLKYGKMPMAMDFTFAGSKK